MNTPAIKDVNMHRSSDTTVAVDAAAACCWCCWAPMYDAENDDNGMWEYGAEILRGLVVVVVQSCCNIYEDKRHSLHWHERNCS